MARPPSPRVALIVAVIVLALAACGTLKRFDYQPTADEIKPGAGLLSSEDGAFVINGE